MREFNLDLLMVNNTTAVNCKTEEEANELLEYLNNKGFKWSGGRNIDNPLSYSYNMNREKTCFAFNEARRLNFSGSGFYKFLGYNIVSLDDLTIKPKNNFKEYGFEADFEGEILKKIDNFYYGIVNQYNKFETITWNLVGRPISGSTALNKYELWELKPIKKEWYENPKNFPCLIKQINCIDDNEIEDDFLILRNIDDYNKFGGDYRHATREEVLSLLVKE